MPNTPEGRIEDGEESPQFEKQSYGDLNIVFVKMSRLFTCVDLLSTRNTPGECRAHGSHQSGAERQEKWLGTPDLGY